MPSPLIHSWLPASCAYLTEKDARLGKAYKWRFFIACILIANSPDWDFVPAILDREHFILIHRNWGHNIFSLTALIVIGKQFLSRFVSKELYEGKAGWVLSSLLVLSHIFLDSLGHFSSTGFRPHIPLLFPISDYQFTFPMKLFVTLDVELPLTIFGGEFWKWLIVGEVIPSLMLFLIFYSVFFLRKSRLIAPLRSPATFVTDLILPKTQSTVNNAGRS